MWHAYLKRQLDSRHEASLAPRLWRPLRRHPLVAATLVTGTSAAAAFTHLSGILPDPSTEAIHIGGRTLGGALAGGVQGAAVGLFELALSRITIDCIEEVTGNYLRPITKAWNNLAWACPPAFGYIAAFWIGMHAYQSGLALALEKNSTYSAPAPTQPIPRDSPLVMPR